MWGHFQVDQAGPSTNRRVNVSPPTEIRSSEPAPIRRGPRMATAEWPSAATWSITTAVTGWAPAIR